MGDRLIFIKGDATSQNDVENFVDKTAEAFGTLDILVNNWGAGTDLQPVNLSDEEFDLCIKWNLYSTFLGTRRALKIMLEKWGELLISHPWKVNMASR